MTFKSCNPIDYDKHFTICTKLNRKANKDLIHYFKVYAQVYNEISRKIWKFAHHKGHRISYKEISEYYRELKSRYNVSSKDIHSITSRINSLYDKLEGLFRYKIRFFINKRDSFLNKINKLKTKINKLKELVKDNKVCGKLLNTYRLYKSGLFNVQQRFNRLNQRIKQYERWLESGKFKYCFGSKELFKKQFYMKENNLKCKKQWLTMWRKARNKLVYIEGSNRDVKANFLVKLYAKREELKEEYEYLHPNHHVRPNDMAKRAKKYFYEFKDRRMEDVYRVRVRVADFYRSMKTDYDKNLKEGKYVNGECYFGHKELARYLKKNLENSVNFRHAITYCEKRKITGNLEEGIRVLGYSEDEIKCYPVSYIFKFEKGNLYLEAIFSFSYFNKQPFTTKFGGVVGLDFNYGFIQMAETNESGNLINLKRYNLSINESSNKSKTSMQETVSRIVNYCKENGKSLSIERLDFTRKKALLYKVRRYKGSKKRKGRVKLNNITNILNYGRFNTCIENACIKKKVELLVVPSSYTTKTAEEKYCNKKKLNSHQGAAFVIARRGQGYLDYYNNYACKLDRRTNKVVSIGGKRLKNLVNCG